MINKKTKPMKRNREIYLYLGTFAALIPTMLLRDFTPANELRYLSIADEALRNHTLFAFTNHGVPYADKPPLYLWAVMLVKWLTGEYNMWILSLLSLIPALGIVRTMNRWTLQEMDEECRYTAGLMLVTCGMFTVLAVTLRMDMLMCLFIILSLRTFWRMHTDKDNNRYGRWLFPIYLFMAVFTKGPLGLFIPLCATTVYLLMAQHIRTFFRYWGWRTWGILSMCCLLWFGVVYMEGGGGYLRNLLLHQTIDRAMNAFHHAEPFYFYSTAIWYCLAPWPLLIAGTVIAALRPRYTRSDLQRFFLTVTVTSFVLLSCISSKLEIYMLPILPFMTYTTMMFLPRFHDNGMSKAAVAVPAAALAAALPSLTMAASFEATRYLHNTWLYAGAGVLTTSGIYAIWILYMEKRLRKTVSAIRTLCTGILLGLSVCGMGLPQLNSEIGYGTLCREALETSRRNGIMEFYTWRISRAENMDVYLHRSVQVIPDSAAPGSVMRRKAILMLRRRDLGHLPGREAQTIGRYAIIVNK